MSFSAQTNYIPLVAWVMYLAVVLWALVYDTMYAMVDKRLHPAAGRSVLAHLIDLERRGKVARAGESWSLV